MDIVASLLQMQLDLYVQTDAQDPDSGALRKEWHYSKTLSCSAKGVVSNAASTRSTDRQIINNKYQNEQYVEIRTTEKINGRHKLTNIRNKKGFVIWTELNYPTETPTVFEVVGVTPITDPFGEVIAYNTLVKRSENQDLGQ
jgi:hypothetical protein